MLHTKEHLYFNQMISAPSHINSELEIVAVNSGTVNVTLENNSFTLEANQMAMILPYRLHAFEPSADAKSFVYMFPQSLAFDVFHSFHDKEMQHNIITPDACTLAWLQNTTARYQKSQENQQIASPFLEKSLLYAFLSEFTQNNTFTPMSYYNSSINCIIEYICTHVQQNITLTSVSRKFGISDIQLNAMIIDYTGLNYKEFVDSTRICMATNLLQYKDMNITQIAYEVGFESQRTFNRTFLRIMNTTPTEFRKKFM